MTEFYPKKQTPEEVAEGLRNAFKQAIKDGVMDATPYFDKWNVKKVETPKQSNWTCYLFGATPGYGIAYKPKEGHVPNRFVRWMMRICFDCLWVEEK